MEIGGACMKKQGPGENSACPLISSPSPHTRSDQSEPTFTGIRPTDVPPFRAAQIVGARFATWGTLRVSILCPQFLKR
jgi:hypothetical protein